MTIIVSPVRKAAVLVAAALTLSVVAVHGAADAEPRAAAPASNPGGWQRFTATGFTSPAGDLCRFTLTSEVLFDAEYVRTTASYPDGKPKRQEYVGPLVVKLTNQASGASIQRDLSGRAVLSYTRDGGYDFQLAGPAAVGFRSKNGDSLPTGFYVLRGYHVIRFAADGIRTIIKDRGTEENVCRTLSSR